MGDPRGRPVSPFLLESNVLIGNVYSVTERFSSPLIKKELLEVGKNITGASLTYMIPMFSRSGFHHFKIFFPSLFPDPALWRVAVWLHLRCVRGHPGPGNLLRGRLAHHQRSHHIQVKRKHLLWITTTFDLVIQPNVYDNFVSCRPFCRRKELFATVCPKL